MSLRSAAASASISLTSRREWRSSPSRNLKEEAELLVAARAAVNGKEPFLWGLDYEVTADRFLFDRMRSKAPAGPAKAAVEALHEKSAAAWKTVSETKNPGAFFSFSTAPDVLAGLRQAWPELAAPRTCAWGSESCATSRKL